MLDDSVIKEIIRGTILSYENGFSLFESAKLLYKNKFYPLSVSVCALSIEELGKTHVISRSIYLDENDEVARKKWYKKKFTNHINKSGVAIYNYNFLNDIINRDIIIKENEINSLKNSKAISKIKEIGLYVNIDDEGNFYSPNELINRETAENYLKSTEKIVSFYYEKYGIISEKDINILVEYYKELILLGKKYEINLISDKDSYETKNIEKLKNFGNKAKIIALKYNL